MQIKIITPKSGVKLLVIKQTKSLCPECLQVLEANIFEEDNKVFIEKTCPVHGKVTD